MFPRRMTYTQVSQDKATYSGIVIDYKKEDSKTQP